MFNYQNNNKMNSKQLNELLASENHSTAIAELKNGRNATEPKAAEYIAVSYTHLTLPTILLV